jgi:hypothetical protein
VLLLHVQRVTGAWRAGPLLAFAFVSAVVLSPFLIIDFHGLISPVSYAVQRPLHIESLAGLLMVFSNLGSPHLVASYGSCNVLTGAQPVVSIACLSLFAAGVLLAYRRVRLGLDSLGRGAILILMITLVTNKVFSPQYLLWILPAVAYVEGFDLRWLGIAFLTSYSFDTGGLCPSTTVSHAASGGLFSFSHVIQPEAALKLLGRDLALGVLALYYLICEGDLAPKET